MSDDADTFAFKPPYAGGYHIVDNHTGSIVGFAKTLKRASRSVDRRDNEYGAYRYSHRRAVKEDVK